MEVTLYDTNGKPVAYYAPNEENSFYLWNGKAVSYLDGEKIYSWNGKHLGWFINDIVYDNQGYQVGYTRSTCPVMTTIESIKTIKTIKSIKTIKTIPYSKPSLRTSKSSMNLKDFLNQKP